MTSADQPMDWPLENRPQDPGFDGSALTIERCDGNNPLPAAIRVTDEERRSCVYIMSG